MILTSRRNPQDSDRAIDIWESITSGNVNVASDDYYRHAKLLRDRSKWSRAFEQMRRAITNSENPAKETAYVAEYISWLLRRDALSDAEIWLERLSELSDGSVASTQLTANWLAKKGDHTGAANELVKFGQKASKGAADKSVADLLVRLSKSAARMATLATADGRGNYESAEVTLFELATEIDESNRFIFASALAKQGKTAEGISVLEESPIGKEELGTALASMDAFVNAADLSDEELDRLASIRIALAEEFGVTIGSMLLEASIYKKSGKTESAMMTYRQILASEPKNLVALNNLAVLMSESDEALDEAADLSDRCIDLGGRVPAFLDTRAVIALAQGEPRLALDLLEEATNGNNESAAIFLFHKAIANLEIGSPDKSRDIFRLAVARGLSSASLSAREVRWYKKLSELEQR